MIDAGNAGSRTRVLHVVTGLGRGGAETSLLRTLAHADRDRFAHKVISLVPGGELASAIRATGTEIEEVSVPLGPAAFMALPRLRKIISGHRPDLVQTWMYHSDLLGGLAARWAGNPPVVWGLHHANLDPALNKWSTIRVADVCARLSRRLPAAIVCCSEATRRVHSAFGYDESRMRVIPNGYEVEEFQPDPSARAAVRAECGIAGNEFVVGMVGRYHPQKDHSNFLAAARKYLDGGGTAHFVLCGLGVDETNAELMALVNGFGLREAVTLLGERNDPQRVMNSFDLGTISSAGEGFPNVVCEMMLCGLPCVVTDVGDAGLIVAETGIVVPPHDADGLAAGWRRMFEVGSDRLRGLGAEARKRIVDNYSAEKISALYHQLWSEIAAK